ncbi:MAG: PHP domain-containing protein [Planctomycetaceae bacterium]|nr:PHP domain-containing protein [Planctomycetaceae bacterium]
MRNETVIPLHVRSGYSMLRGTALPGALVERAAQLGHSVLALTDVNCLAGIAMFWTAAVEAGVRPLVGVELLVGRESVVALIEDEAGYANLCRIITAILAEPVDVPPLLRPEGGDGDLAGGEAPGDGAPSRTRPGGAGGGFSLVRDLPGLSQGLQLVVMDARLGAVLSAAGGGVLRERLWAGIDPAVQPQRVLHHLIPWAHEASVPLAATGAALILNQEDHDVARLLAAIRLGLTFEDVPPDELPPPGAHLRSSEQLRAALGQWPDAIANNRRLVERCEGFKLLPRGPIFPHVDAPAGMTVREHLERLCREGVTWRYDARAPAGLEERMQRELSLIAEKGFSEYFLVVRDIAQYARRRGVPIAARGSGASSLVAYLLGITNVCPLTYGIAFERFLNERRVDFPDLDLDFCWRIRDEIIDYAFDRWGRGHAAMVSTHCTFQGRSALRETAKAFGFSNDQISRMGEGGFDAAEGTVPALAARINGMPHNFSVHPGGIVISSGPIDQYVPVQPAAKGVLVTQMDKDGVEAIGLVKLDLLGNRSLSTIRHSCDLVSAGESGPAIDHESLADGDEATLATLRAADTVGCNQIESPAMRHLLRALQPRGVADLMQALALVRPGAAGIGMKETFIRRRRGQGEAPPGKASPAGAAVEELLRETHGVMLYEDDVMRVAAELTGCSLAEGDRFRKALQKCRDDEQRLRLSQDFLSRCRSRGVDDEYAKGLWVQMAKFNAYSFCRAHAASYAQLAYASAWLKTHYPRQFWVAALNNNQSMYHPRVYVEQAKRSGIVFLPPDVNASGEEFTLDGGCIRVGFNRIAGLGPVGIASLIAARSRRAYESLSDCLYRSGLGFNEGRALILCGAFDALEPNRARLMMELEMFTSSRLGQGGAMTIAAKRQGAMLLAPAATVPGGLEDYTPARKYADALRILGISTGPHLMTLYRPGLGGQTDATSADLPQRVGRAVRIAGLLEARRDTPARDGGTITFLTLDDEFGLFEVVVLPQRGAARGEGRCFSHSPCLISGIVQEQFGTLTVAASRVQCHGR